MQCVSEQFYVNQKNILHFVFKTAVNKTKTRFIQLLLTNKPLVDIKM